MYVLYVWFPKEVEQNKIKSSNGLIYIKTGSFQGYMKVELPNTPWPHDKENVRATKKWKMLGPMGGATLDLSRKAEKSIRGATYSQGFQMNPTSQYIFAHPDFNFTYLYYKHL